MATIEVSHDTKRAVAFAARMAGVTEGEIVRRLVSASTEQPDTHEPEPAGLPIFADYEGHRTRARYFAPSRIQIVDGPLAGATFKSPTGAARAVVRLYNSNVTDNRNGWQFWQREVHGRRAPLQSIRPTKAES
jgi:hypothetical protein